MTLHFELPMQPFSITQLINHVSYQFYSTILNLVK